MERVSLSALLASPSLPRDRERLLARAVRDGDTAARSDLIRLSLRLVAMRVSSLRVGACDVDDALQAGTLGLIAAIDRFDPDRGVRLATYAWPWITASIRAAMAASAAVPVDVETSGDPPGCDLHALVRSLPPRWADVVRVRFRLDEAPDVPRSRAEVAAILGLSVAQVRRAEAQALGRLRRRLARLGDRDPL